MLYGSYALVRPETAMSFDSVPKAFLRSRANSIEGGTTEVMKNILGERILGLPGDVRVDRDIPWSEVPRNQRAKLIIQPKVQERCWRQFFCRQRFVVQRTNRRALQ